MKSHLIAQPKDRQPLTEIGQEPVSWKHYLAAFLLIGACAAIAWFGIHQAHRNMAARYLVPAGQGNILIP